MVFQLFSSQSLSATATPFNLKCQNFTLNSLTAPSKLQTLTASPSFRQDFSSPLKTASDHMPSSKPTKVLTSSTSESSSSDIPQSSQIKLQPPSSIPLPLLPTVTFPCTPTFPSSSTPTAHSSFSAPLFTSLHHLVPHPPSKVLPATPGSSLHVAQHVTEKNANITYCRTSRGMWVNTSEFTGKDDNEIVSCRYSFLTFFMQL